MPNAQDEAFVLLAQKQGLLQGDAAQRALALPGQLGSGDPVAQLLVRQGHLLPGAVAHLLRDLVRSRYGCQQCGQSCDYGALAALVHLRCPACQGALMPLSPGSARTSAVGPAPPASPPRRRSRRTRSPSTRILLPEGGAQTDWEVRETVINKARGPSYREPHTERIAPPPPSQPAGGQTLGPYALVEELGRGTSGVVFLANRPGLKRRFAVKVLLDGGMDEHALERFKREAQVASKLNDSGIVGVYDAGRAGPHYYLVMDYCEGRTLRERLRDGPIPPRQAARLLLRLARTLDAAHAQGILHRDLKPENVILEAKSHRPRLTDFGLARDRALHESLTRSGDLVGTPYYMSPEQLRGVRELDGRSDLYALGVMFYECLTGMRPFEASSPLELIDKVCSEPPTPARELVGAVPPALDAICLGLLAKDRDRRIPDAGELGHQLEAFLEGPTRREPRRPARGRARQLPFLALGLSVLLCGVAWGAFLKHRRERYRLRAQDVARASLANLRSAVHADGPAGTDAQRELERARAMLVHAPGLAGEIQAGERLLSARAALARATALDGPGEADARRAALAEAREAAAGEALLLERVAALERETLVAERLRALRVEAHAIEGFREGLAGAFEELRTLAHADPSREAEIELELLEYLARRGRINDVVQRLEAWGLPPGSFGLRARIAQAMLLQEHARYAEARDLMAEVAQADEGLLGITADAWRLFITGQRRVLARIRTIPEVERRAYLPALVLEAFALGRVGRLPQALELLELARGLCPDHPQVHLGLALVQLNGRNLDSGVEAAATALTLEEPLPSAKVLLTLGKGHLNAQAPKQALRSLGRCVELHPHEIEGWVMLGIAHRMSGDDGLAAEVWREGHRARPQQFERALNNLEPAALRDDIRAIVRGQ